MTAVAGEMREAVSADLAAVRRCAEDAYALYVSRIGKKPAPMVADFAAQIAAKQVHVCVDGDEVLGYIVMYPRDDHMHVENVAVFNAHQGAGVGRMLLDFAERTARDSGLRAMELYTNQQMTENLSYYPRLGYEETGRGDEAGFARVFYRKELG